MNISDLADLIIRQRNVGSVVTQSHDDDDDDSDDDDANDEPNNEVFGLATVIRLVKDDGGICDSLLQHFLR